VGDTVAVFGGASIFTGCSFTFNCAFASVRSYVSFGYRPPSVTNRVATHNILSNLGQAVGTGLMLFMGGGVAVLTGCSAASNIGERDGAHCVLSYSVE
jgi:hypothetical protein